MPSFEQLLGRKLNPENCPDYLKTDSLLEEIKVEDITLDKRAGECFLKSVLMHPEIELETLTEKQVEALVLDLSNVADSELNFDEGKSDPVVGVGKLFKNHSELSFIQTYTDQLHREKAYGKQDYQDHHRNLERILQARFSGMIHDFYSQLSDLLNDNPKLDFGALQQLHQKYKSLKCCNPGRFNYLSLVGTTKSLLEQIHANYYGRNVADAKVVALLSEQLKQWNAIFANSDNYTKTIIRRFHPQWMVVSPLLVETGASKFALNDLSGDAKPKAAARV